MTSECLPVETSIRFTDIPDLEGSGAELGVEGDSVPAQQVHVDPVQYLDIARAWGCKYITLFLG